MNLYYIEWEGESYIVVAPSKASAIFTMSEFRFPFNPLDAKIALGKENPHSFLIVGGDMVFFPDAAHNPETDRKARELLDY